MKFASDKEKIAQQSKNLSIEYLYINQKKTTIIVSTRLGKSDNNVQFHLLN